jgi:hypothetical protein
LNRALGSEPECGEDDSFKRLASFSDLGESLSRKGAEDAIGGESALEQLRTDY